MLGGRLPETENKENVKFLAKKVVAVPLETWVVVAYERALGTVFNWETKRLFTKWSLTGRGRLREVVAMRELTVVSYCILMHWQSQSV